MEVILERRCDQASSRGDVVKVAAGYGRNYLLPKKLAIEANARQQGCRGPDESVGRPAQCQGEGGRRGTGQARSMPVVVNFTRKAGEGDHLFGSVTSATSLPSLPRRASTSTAARFNCTSR